MRILTRSLWAVAAVMLALASCREEYRQFRTENVVLGFSQDTIRFDTLLTGHTSITKRLMVRNPYKEAVRIDRIYLKGGENSRFRINVSGNTELEQYGVVIGGRDSLFVFVNTVIDVRNQDNPFEIVDAIGFEVENSKPREVVLTAWGQDARYWKSDRATRVPFHDPGMFNPDADSLSFSYFDYDPALHRFDEDGKPIVIYGYLAVKEGETLLIPAGTRLYFAAQSGIWVRKGARLQIAGALGQEVMMTSIRQDGDYKNTAGQWGRIWLDAESGPHEVDYACLRNGQTAFWLDSCAATQGGLDIRNTRVENMSSYGIFSNGNRVKGENLCFAGAQASLYLHKGGNYEFVHCTFANYAYTGGYGGSRALVLSDYVYTPTGETQRFPLERALFANSSFTGYSDQQIRVDLSGQVEEYPQVSFDHCLVGLRPVPEDNPWFVSCIWNENPLFKNVEAYNFEIDTAGSPLVGKGEPAYLAGTCRQDILGRERLVPPTIGAYEFARLSLSLHGFKIGL